MPPRKTASPAAPAAAKATASKAAKPAAKAVKKDAAPLAKPLKAVTERFTKTELLARLTDATGLTRKDVSAVLAELEAIIEAHINKKAVGEFVLPGLMKITTVKKPAVKARKGINPFNGEETMFKAKPASVAVKVRPLKKLKEMAL